MKSIYTLILLFSITIGALAQIPNAGFENWTAGEPDGWATSNSTLAGTVTQSSDAHAGVSAVKLQVQPIGGGINMGGGLTIGTNYAHPEGYADNTKPAALHGWYKLNSIGGDYLHVVGLETKNTVGIDGGTYDGRANTTVYKEFVANYIYANSTVDTARITMLLEANPDSAMSPHIGSYVIIDSLSYGPIATGIEQMEAAATLEACSPNPANNIASIKYTLINNSTVTLELYDIAGQKVTTLLSETQLTPGHYKVPTDVSSLPKGMYLYRLTVDGQQFVQKLVVAK